MRKIVSLIVATVFILQNTAFSAQSGISALQTSPRAQSESVFEESFPQVLNTIPSSLGRVTDSWDKGTEGTVIIVEDGHTSLEVQKNSAQIIKQIMSDSLPTIVCVEGFDGELGSRMRASFASVDSVSAKEKISTYLLEHGEMNGAQYAYMTAENPFPLFGVEQAEEYQQDLTYFRAVVEKGQPFIAQIEAYQSVLAHLKKTVYPSQVRMLDSLCDAFMQGEKNEYVVQLISMAQAAKISFAAFPTIRFLLEDPEASCDFTLLIDECSALQKVLKGSILKGDAQIIDKLESMLIFLQSLFATQLKRSEWDVWYKRRYAFFSQLAVYESYLRSLYASEMESCVSFSDVATEDAVYSAYEFYRYVGVRDASMSMNTWRYMKREKVSRAILLAGGFHADGLADHLRELGLSYVRIRPQVTTVDKKLTKRYYERALGSQLPLFTALQAFAAGHIMLENVFTDRDIDGPNLAFFIEVLDTLLTGDVAAAEKQLDAMTVDTDRMFIYSLGNSYEGDEVVGRSLLVCNTISQNALRIVIRDNGVITVSRVTDTGEEPVPDMPTVDAEKLMEQVKEKMTWSDRHTPLVNDYTVVSLQFEAGLDRGLIAKLVKKYGEKVTRLTGQMTLSGGLGALMHDLVVSWSKNGADVISVNPLYDTRIKGANNFSYPLPDGVNSLGDMIRNVLTPMDIELPPLVLRDSKFSVSANNEQVKDLIGGLQEKKIYVKVYESRSVFDNVPLYYLDAYYINTAGEKVHIFDELYPDDDRRTVQMRVYNDFQQMLVKKLQERGNVKKKILFVENEVFTSLPKKEFPDAVIHNINHTVYAPGIEKPPFYAFDFLGFDREFYNDLKVWDDGKWQRDAIDMLKYITMSKQVDFITGVGLAEHTPVLREGIFPFALHKIKEHNRDGLRNTNGALFDMWQGAEIRLLINAYKEILGVDLSAEDTEFYAVLEDKKNSEHQQAFIERFEMIKAYYAFRLLQFLKKFQNEKEQDMGGATWLREILEGSSYANSDYDQLEKEWGSWVLSMAYSPFDADGWQQGRHAYADLRELMLTNPIVANVRRQVPYKGPDKYKEMLEMFSDEKKLEVFRKSKTRLIIGGRTFGHDAMWLFHHLRVLARKYGLEDRIAFIQNYNISDAPTIFRGATGSMMLSDEFLEASATSMMKALANGALLLGVWGGAMPEIFAIRDNANGRVINVFQFIKEHGAAEAHDVLVKGLEEGRYVIENGFLVAYDNEGARSKQHVSGKSNIRRPLTACIFQSLIDFGKVCNDPAQRQKYLMAAMVSSPKVDMQRSQARAHMHLWNAAIERKTKYDVFVSRFFEKTSVETRQALMYDIGDKFKWRKQNPGQDRPDTIHEARKKGLVGLVQSFRELRNRGQEGVWSLHYHTRELNTMGEVLQWFNDALSDEKIKDKEGVIFFTQWIQGFISRAQAAKTYEEKREITLEVLDLVDTLVMLVQERDEAVDEATSVDEPIAADTMMGKIAETEYDLPQQDHYLRMIVDYTKDKGSNAELIAAIQKFMQMKNRGLYHIQFVIPDTLAVDAEGIKELRDALGKKFSVVKRGKNQAFSVKVNQLIDETNKKYQDGQYVVVSAKTEDIVGIKPSQDVLRVSMESAVFEHLDQRSFIMFAFFEAFFEEKVNKGDGAGTYSVVKNAAGIFDLTDGLLTSSSSPFEVLRFVKDLCDAAHARRFTRMLRSAA